MSKSVDRQLDPESVLWNWISDCTKPEGWIRYSPAIARALDSHVAALVLSYAIHCDGHSSGQHAANRWFYKPVHEWADELALPLQSVEKALRTISAPWPQAANSALLDRWLTNRYNHTASAVMHYRVNWNYMLHWWRIQSNNYGQLPLFQELSTLCLSLGILNRTSLAQCDIPVTHQLPAPATLAPRKNDAAWLFRDLIDHNVSALAAQKLVEELADVPQARIQGELTRLGNLFLSQKCGNTKETIENWPGLRVEALRSLANLCKLVGGEI